MLYLCDMSCELKDYELVNFLLKYVMLVLEWHTAIHSIIDLRTVHM